MQSPLNAVMVSRMTKALAKAGGDVTEPPRSRAAMAIMLAKPMLMKAAGKDAVILALASNLQLFAAMADASKEFQEGFETWLKQVNALA